MVNTHSCMRGVSDILSYQLYCRFCWSHCRPYYPLFTESTKRIYVLLKFNELICTLPTQSSNAVLGISPGIDTVGDIRWELLGYLVVAWVGAYLVVWKGLHNSSKVWEEFSQQASKQCRSMLALLVCTEISRLHKTSPISHTNDGGDMSTANPTNRTCISHSLIILLLLSHPAQGDWATFGLRNGTPWLSELHQWKFGYRYR